MEVPEFVERRFRNMVPFVVCGCWERWLSSTRVEHNRLHNCMRLDTAMAAGVNHPMRLHTPPCADAIAPGTGVAWKCASHRSGSEVGYYAGNRERRVMTTVRLEDMKQQEPCFRPFGSGQTATERPEQLVQSPDGRFAERVDG